MKKSFLFVIMMLSSLPFAEAQQSRDRFDISAEVNNRNQVVFRAKRLDNVIFTAVLDIHGTQNLRLAGKFQRFNVRSDGTILTIEPLNPNQSVRYQFGYRYFIGSVSPRKIDRQHIYRLPFGVSASREARNLYNVYDRHFGGDKHSVDFKAFQFIMNRADTVYAARKDPEIFRFCCNIEENKVIVM